MQVSVEVFFLINLVMDLLAIGVIARSWGRIRLKRVMLAAALGAFYATVAQAPRLWALKTLPAQILLAMLLCAIALPVRTGRTLLTAVASLFASAVFLGGVQFFIGRLLFRLPPLAFFLSAAAGLVVLLVYSTVRKKRLVTWEVQVLAATSQGKARFCALVDTGNRLREPLSGLPVMIVEEALVRDLLPPGFDAQKAAENVPPGFRLVGFGALGGSGRMACFQPQMLFVSFGEGYLRAPDVWIAVYPGRMSGAVRALAPPILGCIESSERERRYNI